MSPPRTVVLVRRPAGATRKRTTGRRPVRRRRRSKGIKLRPAQWWPVVLVALVVVVGLAWDADGKDAAVPTDSCTLPASGVTLFGYDANDNLTSVTDPRSLVTNYTYSGFGDLKTQTSPDTGLTTNTYYDRERSLGCVKEDLYNRPPVCHIEGDRRCGSNHTTPKGAKKDSRGKVDYERCRAACLHSEGITRKID